MTDVESIVNWAKVADVVVKGSAILVAAIWTWILFIKRRQRFPRARVRHSIEARLLTKEKRLVRLSVTVENLGDVLIEIASGEVWLQRVLPISKEIATALASQKSDDTLYNDNTEVQWPTVGKEHALSPNPPHEIEPGEHDSFDFDFVVDADVSTLLVNSHIENIKKRKKEIGWNCSTLHDLDSGTEINTEEATTMGSTKQNPPPTGRPATPGVTKQGSPKAKPPSPAPKPQGSPKARRGET